MVSRKEWSFISNKIKSILNRKLVSAEKEYFTEYVKKGIDKKKVFLDSCNKLGTPQYILYEAELIRRAEFFMNTFKKNIPNSSFFYPFKCNDLPYLINTLKNVGFNADVAGLFELELALKMGFNEIVFSSPGKDMHELTLAIQNSDRVTVSIDNVDELKRFLEIVEGMAPKDKVRISFRVSSCEDPSDVWLKFGLNFRELRESVDKIKGNPSIIWSGLHFHSSWNKNPEKYVKSIENIGKNLKESYTIEEIKDLSFIDVGGGFYPEGEGTLLKETPQGILKELLENEGVSYFNGFDPTDHYVEDPVNLEEFSTEISKAVNEHIVGLLGKNDIRIFYEPGRYITKHSTYILTEVLAVKNNGALIVDAGTLTMSGDNAVTSSEYNPIVNISRPSLDIKKTIIYGPLCDPSDFWGWRYYGEDAAPGDRLAILNQGAYTFSFSKRFIKPGALYAVLTKDGKILCARKRESFKDRYSGCSMRFQ